MKTKHFKNIALILICALLFCNIPMYASAATQYNYTVASGIYYIRCADNGKYVQNDDGNCGGGAIIELWPKDRQNYQRWIFTYLGNGYYSIISDGTSFALSVQSAYVNKSGKALVQEVYTGATRQQWSISLSSHGNYIIRPRSGESYSTDWSMCAGAQFLGITNGLNVEQKAYTNNNNLKDEWILEPYKSTLCGITNTGHDHISSLQNAILELQQHGYSDISLLSGEMTTSSFKSQLTSRNLVATRSHGGIVLSANNQLLATSVLLNNEENNESNQVLFYSHPLYSTMPTNQYITSYDSLTNLDVSLFIGCKTGYGGVGAYNLPSAAVNQGGIASIGFSTTINCSDANIWTENFFTALMAGFTIYDSAIYACDTQATISISNIVICGNTQYRICH